MKLPTINDIALAAGLSKCVVSHVLRNDDYASRVRPETRRRIRDIASRLGYVPNRLASATSTGQVNTIAVILNFSQYEKSLPFNQIMAGIMLETSRRRFSVKVFSEDDLEASFRQIVENRISKVIMMGIRHDRRERAAELAGQFSLDLVYAYEHGHGKFPSVNVDNVEMTSKMVRYLAERGHSRIGLLCVPHTHHYKEDRHAGYLKGMKACRLKVDPRWIRCDCDSPGSLEKVLALPVRQRPTAFVALSDGIAARVQSCALRGGLAFPKDISVIGIGDTETASLLPYPLTTMRESLPETGKLLVRLLMKEPVGIRPDKFHVYHTHSVLVERESVHDLTLRLVKGPRHTKKNELK